MGKEVNFCVEVGQTLLLLSHQLSMSHEGMLLIRLSFCIHVVSKVFCYFEYYIIASFNET